MLSLSLSLFASQIRWYGDYDRALALGKKENKNLIIFLIKQYDKKTKELFLKLFSNPQNIKIINEKYISVIVKFEGRGSYPNEMLYTNSFPTIFLISSKNELFIKNPFYTKLQQQQKLILKR